jgi:hypothetical protein
MLAVCLILLIPYLFHDTARSSYEHYIEVQTDPDKITFLEGLKRFFVGDLGAQKEPPAPSFLFDHFNFLILSIFFFVADALFLFLFRPQDLHFVVATLNEPIDKDAFERRQRERKLEEAKHEIHLAEAEAAAKEHKARAREADLKNQSLPAASRQPKPTRFEKAAALEKERKQKIADIRNEITDEECKERLIEEINEIYNARSKQLYVD